MARVAVLVEGNSDREAVLALAAARGADLTGSGVIVVAMGGITNTARHVRELGPRGQRLRLAGLYDAGGERFVRSGLLQGVSPWVAVQRNWQRSVSIVVTDLEDELIRAVGIDRVMAALEASR